jgi:hypothetical protein
MGSIMGSFVDEFDRLHHRLSVIEERIDQALKMIETLQASAAEWLSIKHAAILGDLSQTHLRRAIRSGALPASNAGTPSRPIWRIARIDLAAWMERNKAETAAVPPQSEVDDLIRRHLPGLRGRSDSATR